MRFGLLLITVHCEFDGYCTIADYKNNKNTELCYVYSCVDGYVHVCVWERARVRMRAVSVSVCGRCRFAFVTIYFELDYVCVRTALKRCCCSAVCSFFVIVRLDGNTWGPSPTHSVATWRICTGRKCSPTTAHNRAQLSAVTPLLRC